jgi:hypothetical protein
MGKKYRRLLATVSLKRYSNSPVRNIKMPEAAMVNIFILSRSSSIELPSHEI